MFETKAASPLEITSKKDSIQKKRNYRTHEDDEDSSASDEARHTQTGNKVKFRSCSNYN